MRSRYGLPRYLAGATAARTGDEASGPALVLLGLAATGSTRTAGLILGALTAATALGGPVLGAVLDRARRPPRVLAGCLLAYAVGLALLTLVLARAALWPAVLVAGVAGAFGPALSAGWSSRLGALLSPAALRRGYAADSASFAVAALAGPALAGLLSAALRPAHAVLSAAVLLLVAIPLAATLPSRPPTPSGPPPPHPPASSSAFHPPPSTSSSHAPTSASPPQPRASAPLPHPPAPASPPPPRASTSASRPPASCPAGSGFPRHPPAPSCPLASAPLRDPPASASPSNPPAPTSASGPCPPGSTPPADPPAAGPASRGPSGPAVSSDPGRQPTCRRGGDLGSDPRTAATRRGEPDRNPAPGSQGGGVPGRDADARGRDGVAGTGAAGGTRPEPYGEAAGERPAAGHGSLPAALRRGALAVLADPTLRSATLVSALSYLGVGAATVALPVLGAALTGRAGAGALLLSVTAGGALLSTAALARWPVPLGAPARVAASTAAMGAGLAVLALAWSWPVAVLGAAVVGLGDGPQLAALLELRHRAAPSGLRTQVFAAGVSVKQAGYAVGAGCAGVLATASPRPALVLAVLAQAAALAAAALPTHRRVSIT